MNKGWPRYISETNDGKLTVRDVLFFIMNTGSAGLSATAKALLAATPADVLDHKPWEKDEL
jgi:hypothetical protein